MPVSAKKLVQRRAVAKSLEVRLAKKRKREEMGKFWSSLIAQIQCDAHLGHRCLLNQPNITHKTEHTDFRDSELTSKTHRHPIRRTQRFAPHKRIKHTVWSIPTTQPHFTFT